MKARDINFDKKVYGLTDGEATKVLHLLWREYGHNNEFMVAFNAKINSVLDQRPKR